MQVDVLPIEDLTTLSDQELTTKNHSNLLLLRKSAIPYIFLV
jgi:hypothetical protein